MTSSLHASTQITWNDPVKVVDEPRATVIQEETWLQGTFLSNFFFGIQTALCILASVALLQRRKLQHGRMRIVLLAYLAALFAVTTAAQALLLVWMQMGFITRRSYPGGPSAFLNDQYSTPVNLVSTILVVCANWMMESLLVWRCYIVCRSGDGRLWWLSSVIPLVLLIGVFVTGSLFIHFTLRSATPASYALAYGISSLLLNLSATGIIAARLLVYRHHVVRQLGRGHGQHYVSAAAVVVESAAIYTSFLVVVIVAYGVGSPATNLLQQIIEQVQAITSVLIILRIARGEGWRMSTDTELAAAISSWYVGQEEQNVIQLEVVSTRHEVSMSRKGDKRMDPDLFHEGATHAPNVVSTDELRILRCSKG